MSTFLQVVELLLTNNDAKAQYDADPSSFLDTHGLGELDSADVTDAMTHASDALPIPVAVRLDPESGLDSAAALDLEAEGLSLEREPLDLIEPDPYGSDVDFDTPDSPPDDEVDVAAALPDAAATASDEAADSVDGVIDATDADTLADDALDTGEYLTDVPVEPTPDEGALEGSEAMTDLGIEDLDVDLTTDLPDDFDLLD